MTESRRIIGSRIALAAMFVGVAAAMHVIGARCNIAYDSGPLLLSYNLLSIVFLVLTGASFFSLGALLLRKATFRSALDSFLVSSVLGFCAFQIIGYIIGLLSLLSFGVALALLAAPLLFFPEKALPPYAIAKRNKLLLAAFAIASLYVLCFSGILQEYIENDFSHYYYFYDTVLHSGSLLPDITLFDYFYMKGAGAPFLMMAATTKFSIQIAVLYALLMMALMTFRIAAIFTNNKTAQVASVLLLLASKFIKIESYKGHVLISMLLLAVPYLMIKIHFASAHNRMKLHGGLVLLLSAILLFSPPAAIFLVIPTLLYLCMCVFVYKEQRARLVATVIAGPALMFVAVLLSNYLLSGMPEVTPLPIFSRYFNLDVTKHWISQAAILLTQYESLPYDGVADHKSKVLLLLFEDAALAILYLLARKRLLATYRITMIRAEAALSYVLSMGALCPLLYLVMHQHSVRRFMVFYSAIQGLYVVFGATLFFAFASSLLRKRGGATMMLQKVRTTLFVAMACYPVVFSWTPRLPQQIENTKYFFGAAPMSAVLGHWYAPEVPLVDAYVPDGCPVLPLYFSPYATLYKPQKYYRHVLNPYTQDLFGLHKDAEATREAYLQRGLRFFVVNLTTDPDPMLSMTYEAYGALFSVENVAKYFRVRRIDQSIWLLVLDGDDSAGERPSAEFLAAYARRRASDIASPRNIFYPTYARVEQLYPALLGIKP